MSKNIAITGTGSVLPAGSLPKVGLGNSEDLTITVLDFGNQDGMNIARIKYPDGFIKNHQAESIEDLLGKIENQMRGRYGVSTFEYDSVPKLVTGTIIQIKGVQYGA